jgi:phosphatidate cytidylyltransferase
MSSAPPKPIRFADLGLRLLSGLGLAVIAFADLWLGGLWVAVLAGLAAGLMLWEYQRIVTGPAEPAGIGLALFTASGAAAAVATSQAGLGWGIVTLAILGAPAIAASRQRLWLAAGLGYIGFGGCYLVALRGSDVHGLPTILWLILVVVATDVGAYFVGRLLGGPKLWPRVSPGKTWAGGLGGAGIAVLAGLGFALGTGRGLVGIAFLSLAVSVAAQLGDLLESALKRRYKVKDSSSLIPGHGGVMDRLDGLVGALWLFAVIDIVAGYSGE